MTDNEIIKALEICIDFVSGGESMCKNCPLYDCNNCSEEQRKQALDLINRQKAEIERLQSQIETLNKSYPCTVDVGNNCLVYARSLEDYDRLIGDISNEGIKEFANEIVNIILPKLMYGHEEKATEIAFALSNKVAELTEPTKIEHNSLCETETYESR